MSKKKKSSPTKQIIHIRQINDCLSAALGLLSVKEIIKSRRTSSWFAKRCSQALRVLEVYDHDKQGLDSDALGYLLSFCHGIERIVNLPITRASDAFAIVRVWRNLKTLDLESSGISDHQSLQYALIPRIARSLPNLQILHLLDILRIPTIDVSPLSTLSHLRKFSLLHNGTPEAYHVVGLEKVILKCPIDSLCVDESCHCFVMLEKCEKRSLKTLYDLSIFSTDVTTENCHTLATCVPNLSHLQLSSSNISNEGIEELSSLKRLYYLRISFDSLNPLGMSYLTGHGRFPALREICWMGDLRFEEEWLEVLRNSRPDFFVDGNDNVRRYI